MSGFLFIFNFMNKVRNVIVSDEGTRRQLATKAFVSIRVMQSLRDTWGYWYKNHKNGEVKTLQEGMISFFNLFTDTQKQWLMSEVDYDSFVKIIKKKENENFGFDSEEDIKTAQSYVDVYLKQREERLKGK